jgi:hypothetical protein
MVEYTCEFLNSDCDIEWIGTIVKRAVPQITSDVFRQVDLCQKDSTKNKKILFDLITERNIKSYSIDLERRRYQKSSNDKNIDFDLTWKYAMEIIVKELKKIFIDSNIYYENKEITDIHDNITIHRLIRVDWSELHDDI